MRIGIRGTILNIIIIIYENAKSKVIFNNVKGEEFVCYTEVRQGECFSPFLFSMFVNDLEQGLISKDIQVLDLAYFSCFYFCI